MGLQIPIMCVSVSYRPDPTTPNHSAHVSVEGGHRTSPPGPSVSCTYGSRHHSEESSSTHYEYVCMCMCVCVKCNLI